MTMPALFTHILLPVDGSLMMAPLVRRCLAIAAAAGARVEALHVLPPEEEKGGGDGEGVGVGEGEDTARAALILAQVDRDALEQGVACHGRVVRAAQPWQAIVDAAREGGADVICMGAHGRLVAPGQPLGSQTAQVLAHPGVPVLVMRSVT